MITPSPHRLVFSSQNFLGQGESLGDNALLAERSDLRFVIGAPPGYAPPSAGDLTLFLDQAGQRRTLADNCYQITCPEPIGSQELLLWSQQVSQRIRDVLICPGLVGIDWLDLLQVLQSSQNGRLVALCLDYAADDQLPLAALQQLRFRNLLACIFGRASLGLDTFSELGNVLERINPDLELFRIGMLIHPDQPTRLLLLGEPSQLRTDAFSANQPR